MKANLNDGQLGENKLRKIPVIGEFADDMRTAGHLIRDFAGKRYKNVPWKMIVWGVIAVTYNALPIELFPNITPFLRHIDGAIVIAMMLWFGVDPEVAKYRKWLDEQQ